MRQQFAVFISVGIALLLIGETVAQQTPHQQSARVKPNVNHSPPLSSPNVPLPVPSRAGHSQQAILREINAIRSQFGGGLSQQFKDFDSANGKNWQQATNQMFISELQQIARADSTNAIAAKSRVNSTFRAVLPPQTPPSVEILRSAAQTLEGIAARFEENRLYVEADEIREQAKRFWQKAREKMGPNRDPSNENGGID